MIKKYWKNWLILLLALMNLATLGTIFYHNRCNPNEDILLAGSADRPLNGKCFVRNMEFTSAQTASFREINSRFRQKVCGILPQLQEQKNRMFQALQQQPADTLYLQETARRIGDLHYRLKKETACFYLTVRNLCTPAQKQKLEQYFIPLFGTEGCPRSPECKTGKCQQKNF